MTKKDMRSLLLADLLLSLLEESGDSTELRRKLAFTLNQNYSDYMQNSLFDPRLLVLVMNYKCVYQCNHCFFYSTSNSSESLSQEEIQEALSFTSGTNVTEVFLSGGEPMLLPEKVLSTIRQIKDMGLTAHLQSTYMGETEDQLRDIIASTVEAGLDKFSTSISLYHKNTFPQNTAMDYLDYMTLLIDHMAGYGIEIHVKISWDLDNDIETTALANQFASKLHDTGAHYLGQPFGLDKHLFHLDGSNINIIKSGIVAVGRARTSGLNCAPMYSPETKYRCPIFFESHHLGGMLVIYPDGNVARCCSAEKGADFGFGNIRTHSWSEILENISSSKYVTPFMGDILREAHSFLQENYPNLLPSMSPVQACEICSPIVARPKLKKQLDERIGFDIFTPYSDRQLL